MSQDPRQCCTKCGEAVETKSKFCSFCGAGITKLEVTSNTPMEIVSIENFEAITRTSKPIIEKSFRMKKKRSRISSRLAVRLSYFKKSIPYSRKRGWSPKQSRLKSRILVSVVVAAITIGVLDLAKGLSPLNYFPYLTSTYYRYGFDSVTNIESNTSQMWQFIDQTFESFNEWVDPKDLINIPQRVQLPYTPERCVGLFKLRGLAIVINNLTNSDQFTEMRNSESNKKQFIQGCMAAGN